MLTLATLITGATSFQTTFAQPMMGERNMGVGNGVIMWLKLRRLLLICSS